MSTNPILKLRDHLNDQFLERKAVIDGALCALLTGENVLLVGPAGAAKSAIARAICSAFGGHYFEHLMSRFTVPEELFGPISLKALENDQFVRVIDGKAPTADVIFLDEIWKSGSSILNTLLSLMNEKTFCNGGQVLPVPLISLIGSSNELPESTELEALFDRFLLRYQVGYLMRPSNLRQVLTAKDNVPRPLMTMADLHAAQAEVAKVTVTDETVDALLAIRDSLKTEGITASDRRWKKCLKVLKATAWLAGETKTAPEDAAALVDAVWRDPKDRSKIARTIGKVADPVGAQAAEILDSARESTAKVAALATTDRKAYISQAAACLEALNAQRKRLAQLAKGAGRRASGIIQEATTEIGELHSELARAVSTGLGLRSTAP